MMTMPSLLSWLGLLIGLLFGAIAQVTGFCFYRGLKERWQQQSGHQLHCFALALALALLGTQSIAAIGWVDLSQSIYRSHTISWLLLPLGGILFGYGMALANGCGARALVLLGQGNLRSLVVLLCLGISALVTLTGVLAPLRLGLSQLSLLQLPHSSPTAWGHPLLWAGLITLPLLLFALRAPSTPNRNRDLLGAACIGLLIIAGWLSTGWIGADPFDPKPSSSLSFVVPVGESIQYLMLASGVELTFTVTLALGVCIGSGLSALLRQRYQREGFSTTKQLVQAIQGGSLMGVGGVLGMGCTIGQGLSGVSTLAYASVITLLCIGLGAWLQHQRSLSTC